MANRFVRVQRNGELVNVLADEDGLPFSPPAAHPETNIGDGIGVVTETLQTAGPSRNNERKPLETPRDPEVRIPDRPVVERKDVFPGWSSSWVNGDWRLPKEESVRLLEHFEDIPVRMAYVQDPSHFFVIREDEYNECRTFCQKVGSVMAMGSEVYLPGSRNNLAVLRCRSLDTWKRLEILKYLPDHGAYARLMDEGQTTTITLPRTDILKLDESLKDEPGYAILCSLDVEPVGDTWPESILKTLSEDFADQVVEVRCIKQIWGLHVTHIVKMFLPGSDKDYGTMLVEGGLAKQRTDLDELSD